MPQMRHGGGAPQGRKGASRRKARKKAKEMTMIHSKDAQRLDGRFVRLTMTDGSVFEDRKSVV